MRRALVLLLCLTGCAGSAPPQDPATVRNVKGTLAPRQTLDLTRETVFKTTELRASRAHAWKELLAAHEALGFEMLQADERAGHAEFQVTNRLRTINNKPASKYLDCGSGPAGQRTESYRLTVRVTHSLQSRGEGASTLQTAVQAWARNPGISGDPVSCSSLGLLETEINGIVAMRTGG